MQKRGNKINNSGIVSKNKKFVYYFGIIDTLTPFGFRKTGEFIAKRIFQGDEISCVPPKKYKNRFLKFMSEIIVND